MKRPFLFLPLLGICSAFLWGCSAPEQLTALPASERTPIVVKPFADLTGQYSQLEPFEPLARATLSADIFTIDTPDIVEKDARTSYHNPFLPISGPADAAMVLTGDVERIEYMQYQDVKRAIEQYHFLGPILSRAFNPDAEDMTALVQYRVTVIDGRGSPVDSFLVVALDSGPVNRISRRTLMSNASISPRTSFRGQCSRNI